MNNKRKIKILTKIYEKITINKTNCSKFYEELERKLKINDDPVTEKITIADPFVINGNPIVLGHITEYIFLDNNDETISFICVTDLNGVVREKYLIKSSVKNTYKIFETIKTDAVANLNKYVSDESNDYCCDKLESYSNYKSKIDWLFIEEIIGKNNIKIKTSKDKKTAWIVFSNFSKVSKGDECLLIAFVWNNDNTDENYEMLIDYDYYKIDKSDYLKEEQKAWNFYKNEFYNY